MKKKILLKQFFIILFLTGTMESIIAGIMPFISSEYQVSDSITGQLTTIYTGIFAIFGPILVFSLRKYQSKLIGYKFVANLPNDGNKCICWVDDNNLAAIRLNESIGFSKDGLKNYIFLRNNKN